MNGKIESGQLADTLRGWLKAVIVDFKLQNSTLFTHYYQGTESKAGAIRLTAAQGRENPKVDPLGGLNSSDDLFSKHIRVFGRQCTLLDWMDKWIESRHDKQALDHIVTITPSTQRIFAHQVENRGNKHIPARTRIWYSKKFLDLLCEETLTGRYFIFLASTTETAAERNLYRDAFLANRGKALQLLEQSRRLHEVNQLASVLAGQGSENPSLQEQISVLGALQSILVFHRVSCTNEEETRLPIVCQISEYAGHYENDDGSKDENPKHVFIRIPAFGADLAQTRNLFNSQRHNLETMSHLISKIKEGLQNAKQKLNRYNEEIFLPEEANSELQNLSYTKFAGQEFAMWRFLLIQWMLAITQRLREEMHEGERLGFWLVAGDKSRIGDHEAFRVNPLAPENLNLVKVWTGEEPSNNREKSLNDNIHSRVVLAARAIGKLNYPWFQDGRYALFWDITFPNKEPVGLLEVRNSTWERWEATLDRRSEQNSSSDGSVPPLILVHARPDGTAGLAIAEQRVLLARRREPKWELAWSTKRETWIREKCFDPVLNQAHGTILARVIIRIAEDPRRGCMIIVLKKDTKIDQVLGANGFQKMGAPWQMKGKSPI
ncbi:MAG: hypothetical protein L0Y43_10025, partial [Methylococcaceae bacterium]|nr:hypothetical protein [Methylococcaceae bacterium]